MINYEYDKKRFEMFVDAILAIILTILVLELKIPETVETSHMSTQEQLKMLIPSFISYIGSFMLIVGIWIDHHLLFLNLTRVTKRYIIWNMLFLLTVSIVPFTTAFAGHHYDDAFAVALLFVNYAVMNFLFGSLFIYARVKKLVPLEYFSDNKGTAIYSNIGIIGLIAAIPLAYVNTFVSFALGIIVFTGHLMKKR